MIKSKYESNCVVALVRGQDARILGAMKKDAPYLISEDVEIVTAPTLEDLKTLLMERGLKFNQTKPSPIS